jgi:hypothetical protein
LQNYNTRGFQSSIEPLLLFGLGKVTSIDTLEVIWPDKKGQIIIDVKGDQTVTLKNEDASAIKITSRPNRNRC